MLFEISSAVGIHIGKKRHNNEDNFYNNGIFLDESNREIPAISSDSRTQNLQFYAVFDGMGGEEKGEWAALIAAKTLGKYQNMLSEIKFHDIHKYIQMYSIETCSLISEKAKELGASRIGTTIALLCIEGDSAHAYNIGDSRIYLLRGKKIAQLSEDHTPVTRAIRLGMMSTSEAKKHPHRNKLTQYLGIPPEEQIVKPHRTSVKLRNNDQFFLCSDGVTDFINDEKLLNLLLQNKSEKEIIANIIDEALNKGGKDNITALIIKALKAFETQNN